MEQSSQKEEFGLFHFTGNACQESELFPVLSASEADDFFQREQ